MSSFAARFAACLSAVLALASASNAAPSITRAVDMTPYQQPGASLDVDVALGDGDALAFRTLGSDAFGTVYRGSWRGGSIITIIGDNFGPTRSLSVNAAGAVGFVGNDGQNLYRSGAGGNIITIRGDQFGLSNIDSAQLGDTGQFTFGATNALGSGLFSGPSANGVMLTIRGQNFADASQVGDPDSDDDLVPDDDMIAFRGTDSSNHQLIYSTPRLGGVLLTISGSSFSEVSAPQVGGGMVAFAGRDGDGNGALYAASLSGGTYLTINGSNFGPADATPQLGGVRGGGIRFISQSSSTLAGVASGPALFAAGPENGFVAERLVGVGDALDGSFITRLLFSPQGVNALGELAFYAELANGTSGIYISSNIPGPGALAIAGMSVAAILGRRRR